MGRAGVKVTVLTVGPLRGNLPGDLPPEVRVLAVPEHGFMPRLNSISPGRGIAAHLRTRGLIAARAALYHWMVPDSRAGFIDSAVSVSGHPDVRDANVVLATGGPWSDFVAGDLLARRLGVPFVLDYRDPWTTYPRGWNYSPGLRSRLVARGQERGLLQRAAMVVSAHQALPGLLERELRVPGLTARSHWIPNGYDPEDFAGLTAQESPLFTLTWAGSLYTGRTLSPIFRVLSDLTREGAIPLDKLKVRVYDRLPDRIRLQCGDPELRTRLDTPGEIPHRDVLRAITDTTVNLLVDLNYAGPVFHTPGKLYEYLAAGRPILAITGEGVQGDLIREAAAGWVVPPGDPAALRAALLDAFRTWERGGDMPVPHPRVVERYDRSKSSARLRELLEGLRRTQGSA
jgi:glycosyltransferase involved in cell wall biosynthesis